MARRRRISEEAQALVDHFDAVLYKHHGHQLPIENEDEEFLADEAGLLDYEREE